MKKHWILITIVAILAVVICLSVIFFRDIGPSGTTGPSFPHISRPTGTTSSNDPTSPSFTDPEAVARLYLCGQEDPAAYEALAARYTAATGGQCEIVTGDLEALLENENAPTIFCTHSSDQAAHLAGYMLDLTGSAVMEALYSPDFALYREQIPVALPMDLEGYGIIYNASLLAQAGYTRSDITDFASLKAIVEHISADKKVLGFRPFCKADLGDTVLVEYLAGIPQTPQAVRSFFDLYIANSTTSGDPLTQFLAGKTVFYVGGTWQYDAISDIGINNLDMLPLYTADGGSFQCVCQNWWSVNARAAERDIQASLGFLQWLVQADESGTAPVDSLGWLSPFADATAVSNSFQRLFRKYIATEEVSLRWNIVEGMTAKELADLTAALASYAASPNDDTWAQVAVLLETK